jgi:hypothetical protein
VIMVIHVVIMVIYTVNMFIYVVNMVMSDTPHIHTHSSLRDDQIHGTPPTTI